MELSGINIIALLIITVLVITISIAVIDSIGTTVRGTVTTQIKETFSKAVLSILQRSPYNVCEGLSGRQISTQEFQNLLLAAYNGQCGSERATVTLSSSYAKEDIEKIARINGIAGDGKLIYYREAKPFGIGSIIIQGNPGYFPLKKWDTIEVWSAGKPAADTLINITVQGCDPYDDVCQAGCTYKKICDPVCDDGKKHDITCNIACIDTDSNGIDTTDMEARVAANKCNPDCYGNRTNPFRAYDPGCVWKFKDQHDDICDPNSNGVIDGVCDPDCINAKGICDFDCNGTVYAGNPTALKDEKCFACDGKCNGWCSPACNKNAVEGMDDYDPDCKKEIDAKFWCSGDGSCENAKGESCENSEDCKQICSDQSLACCPLASDSDYAGCTATKDLKEGSACGCDSQCGQLKCDETKHCCPKGKEWDEKGKECKFKYKYVILFLQLNAEVPDFKQKAEAAKNVWIKLSPLKNCPDFVKALVIENKVCSAGNTCLTEEPFIGMQQCMETWEEIQPYKNLITRIVGVDPKTFLCGGIAGYTTINSPYLVSGSGMLNIVCSHEMGHTYGLCDEAYDISQTSQCPSGYWDPRTQYCCPNAPATYCVMYAGGPMTMFAPDCYANLETQLNKYCR